MYFLRFCFKILREQVDCGWLLIILDQNLYIYISSISKKNNGDIVVDSNGDRNWVPGFTKEGGTSHSPWGQQTISLSLSCNVYRISTHLYVTFVIISVNRSWDPKILILSWQWISLQWSSTWSTQSRAPTEICRPCHIKAAWLPPNVRCTTQKNSRFIFLQDSRGPAKTSIMTSCVQQSATVLQ